MPNNDQDRLKKILELMVREPNKAADELDKIGDHLKKVASRLRQRVKVTHDGKFKSEGGAADVVHINVVGPGRENQ